MEYICGLIGLAFLIAILSPFWLGSGGLLISSTMYNDPEKIKNIQNIILKKYVEEEQAHQNGSITKGEWLKRSQYLFNRYLDLSRRSDYLKFINEQTQKPSTPQEQGV